MAEMREWLSVDELAGLLDVPKETVYQWNRKGSGPEVTRVGRHVRYHRAAVDAWLAAHTKAAV